MLGSILLILSRLFKIVQDPMPRMQPDHASWNASTMKASVYPMVMRALDREYHISILA